MYYLIILVLLFLAELFISVLLINAISSINRTNGVRIPGSRYGVEVLFSTWVHWLIF